MPHKGYGVGSARYHLLTLEDQGVFQLGYYHQKQKLWTKKEDRDNG